MTTAILPFQLLLRQRLPLVQGNVDYQQVRQLLQRMEENILLGGLELMVVRYCLEKAEEYVRQEARRTGRNCKKVKFKDFKR